VCIIALMQCVTITVGLQCDTVRQLLMWSTGHCSSPHSITLGTPHAACRHGHAHGHHYLGTLLGKPSFLSKTAAALLLSPSATHAACKATYACLPPRKAEQTNTQAQPLGQKHQITSLRLPCWPSTPCCHHRPYIWQSSCQACGS
jgi:hypothetical protein